MRIWAQRAARNRSGHRATHVLQPLVLLGFLANFASFFPSQFEWLVQDELPALGTHLSERAWRRQNPKFENLTELILFTKHLIFF